MTYNSPRSWSSIDILIAKFCLSPVSFIMQKKSAGCLTNKTGPVHWKCFFTTILSLSLLTLIIFSAIISNAATTSARKKQTK